MNVLPKMRLFKSFLRMYMIDIILFSILFGLGYYVKNSVTTFFQTVGEYQANITALQPGFANQSSSALLAAQPLITDFHSLVVNTFILALVIGPFLAYVLFVLGNSYLLSRPKNRAWKYFGISFLLGLPLLILFYSTMDIFFQSFGNFMYSQSALILFIVLLLAFFLFSYCWYTLVARGAHGNFKDYSLLYKKLFPLFFVFLLFYVIHLFLLFFLVYILVAVMTDSFLGSQLWTSLGIFLIVLVFLELARLWYLILLEKEMRKLAWFWFLGKSL